MSHCLINPFVSGSLFNVFLHSDLLALKKKKIMQNKKLTKTERRHANNKAREGLYCSHGYLLNSGKEKNNPFCPKKENICLFC